MNLRIIDEITIVSMQTHLNWDWARIAEINVLCCWWLGRLIWRESRFDMRCFKPRRGWKQGFYRTFQGGRSRKETLQSLLSQNNTFFRFPWRPETKLWHIFKNVLQRWCRIIVFQRVKGVRWLENNQAKCLSVWKYFCAASLRCYNVEGPHNVLRWGPHRKFLEFQSNPLPAFFDAFKSVQWYIGP